MADVTVEGSILATSADYATQSLVWVSRDVGYVFYVSSADNDIYYRKTTDGGASWGSGQLIEAGTGQVVTVWYDRWTPGLSGSLIHILYHDSAAPGWYYDSLDTSNDTLSGEVLVTGTSWTVTTNARCASITRAASGNLIVCMTSTSTGQAKTMKSTAVGASASFADITACHEGTGSDFVKLFPANLADASDIWALFYDASATELSLKTYDDSGNSWSEASIQTGITAISNANGGVSGFAGCLRHSDGNLLVAAWTERDTVTADFKFWDIANESSISAGGNLDTDTDDSYGAAVTINYATGRIYVFYLGSDAGSQTIGTTVSVYYKYSDDGGGTWSAQQAYSEGAADDYRSIWADLGSNGPGRIGAVWFDDDDNDYFFNAVNSIAFGPLVKVLDDSEQIAEALRAPRVLRRMQDDAVELSEGLYRRLLLRRFIAETVEISQGISSLLGQAGQALIRVLDDTVDVLTSLRRPIVLTRSRSETVEITETLARPMALRRLLAETVEVTEAIRRLMALRRVLAETVEITETLRRPMALRRLLAETLHISHHRFYDTFSRANGSMGNAELGPAWETLSGTWTVAGGRATATAGAAAHLVIETSRADVDVRVTVAVVGADGGILVRVVDDANLWLVDIVADTEVQIWQRNATTWTERASGAVSAAPGDVLRVVTSGNNITAYLNDALVATYSSSLHNTATKHGLGDYNTGDRCEFDDFQIDDIEVVKQRGLLRILGETIELLEALRRPITMRRFQDETVEITETIRRPMVLRRLLAETVESTDSIRRLLALRRVQDETVEISETTRRPLALRRLIAETVEITEVLASSIATLLIKIIQDTIEITEALRRALGLKRQTDETVEITEALRRPMAMHRVANETVEIVEALLRPRVLVRLHTATVEITSAVARRVALRRLVSTTVEIAEGLRRPLALSRARSETVEISETILRPMVLRRLLAETVEITETIRRSSGLVGVLVRVVNEALQIGEGRQVALTVTNLALATVRVYRATAAAYVKGRNFVARIVRPTSSAEIDR